MQNLNSRIKSILNKFSLKHSFRFIFIYIFIIPVLVISVIFISVLYNSLLSSEMDKVQANLVRAEEDFNNTLTTIRNFSDRIYVNKTLQNIILNDYQNVQQVYAAYSNLSYLDDYLISFNEVMNFRIYSTNYTLLDNQYIIKATPVIQSEKWYENAIKVKGQVFWTYKKDTVTNKDYLCLVRSIWSSTNGDYVGVLVVNVNPDIIKKNISNQVYDTILMYENDIIYSSDTKINNSNLDFFNSISKMKKTNKLMQVKIDGKNKGYFSHTFYPSNSVSVKFNIIYLLQVNRLKKATNSIIIYSAIIIGFFLMLSVLGIFIYSFYLDERITLEKETITARQNEMRFKMLSTQINPHFLFNTLETIRMKSLAGGDKDTATMLKLLASLLRYNLSVKGKPVPLIDEIEAVQNYLNIQHMRFGERISYDVITMCDIQKINILPLLIQPLVENSFSHGLEEKVRGGFIYILVNADTINDKQYLIITVKDNGKGMSEEKLKEIKEKLSNENVEDYTKSIGMVNVNSRIKMYYGNDCGIDIESEEGKGTTVKLTLLIK